jgi:hypothetical protein
VIRRACGNADGLGPARGQEATLHALSCCVTRLAVRSWYLVTLRFHVALPPLRGSVDPHVESDVSPAVRSHSLYAPERNRGGPGQSVQRGPGESVTLATTTASAWPDVTGLRQPEQSCGDEDHGDRAVRNSALTGSRRPAGREEHETANLASVPWARIRSTLDENAQRERLRSSDSGGGLIPNGPLIRPHNLDRTRTAGASYIAVRADNCRDPRSRVSQGVSEVERLVNGRRPTPRYQRLIRRAVIRPRSGAVRIR